jgi:membrane-bound lytic murein transglycosylase D
MFKWWIYTVIVLAACSEKPEVSVQSEKVISHQDSLPFKVPSFPEKIMFCDSEFEITDSETEERIQRELITNVYYHSATIQILLRTKRYFPLIDSILKSNGIPADMRYLCVAESALTNARSPAGALGFWQFMPETGKEYDLTINTEIDERLHLEKSTTAACAYLKKAYNEFGDWSLAAASYNMGMGGVREAIERQGEETYAALYLNSETSRYVMRIIALKYIIENPEDYGFQILEEDFYQPIQSKTKLIFNSIPDLAKWTRQNKVNYKMFKVLNPWIIGTKLTIPKGQSQMIQLPIE